mgnify:CR=1 FL=1
MTLPPLNLPPHQKFQNVFYPIKNLRLVEKYKVNFLWRYPPIDFQKHQYFFKIDLFLFSAKGVKYNRFRLLLVRDYFILLIYITDYNTVCYNYLFDVSLFREVQLNQWKSCFLSIFSVGTTPHLLFSILINSFLMRGCQNEFL